jgi:hypothetical protein
MKATVLLLLALLVACSSSPPSSPPAELAIRPLVVDRTIHGDTRFPVEERILAEFAAEAWRAFSAGRVRFAIVWDYDERTFLELAERPHLVRVSPGLEKVSLLDAHARGRVLGYVDGVEIGIVAERCAEFYPVVLHELGHAAGLLDVDSPGAVMAGAGPGWSFKRADRLECQRVGLCEVP